MAPIKIMFLKIGILIIISYKRGTISTPTGIIHKTCRRLMSTKSRIRIQANNQSATTDITIVHDLTLMDQQIHKKIALIKISKAESIFLD
ncbi:MAG: hypothetical protein UT37_C0003G0018 [Parcubacteria group bacterium GW2011_GWA2_39_18]|nr:MAG: hypothetical protein UT37_C0003G0018 [Parcubacteria group bacterium GW2011_GWA2_39_18]